MMAPSVDDAFPVTEIGFGENIEGVLCYALGPVSATFFLTKEWNNNFVRFHAIQSILASITLMLIVFLIPITLIIALSQQALDMDAINALDEDEIIKFFSATIGVIIAMNVLVIVAIAFLVRAMYKAFLGERYKLPLVGTLVERWSAPPPDGPVLIHDG